MNHWLVKQEPETYPYAQLVKDGKTAWTGVRNFQARNNLRAMKKGDTVLYYHSVNEKAVVGTCEVMKEAYPDPTAEEGDWSVVDLKAVRAFKRPVTLEEVKKTPALKNIALIRQSRLSVMPLSAAEYKTLVALGSTTS
jgi:predicted RNA-binding protein with PUA-like domain